MFLHLTGALFLLLLIYQDFKSRQISWVLLPLLFGVLLTMAVSHVSWKAAGISFLINLAFLVLQFSLVWIYFSIKSRKPVNIFDTMIGWGDVLLLLVLCMGFSTMNFIVFYLCSLILIVASFLVISTRNTTIPLAGILAFLLLVVWIIPGLDIYSDSWFENLLYNG